MSELVSFLVGMFGFVGAAALGTMFLAKKLKKSTDPGALVGRWVITVAAVALWIYLGVQAKGADLGSAFIIPAAAAASGIVLAILWAPDIAGLISSPLTKLYDGGDAEPELRPLYSIATAYRKRGNYDKAIAEIRRQLGNFPEDFEGWMMLAEVQAEDMKDIDAASQTIDYILTLPELAPKNASFALGRLADWYLNLTDRENAQRALERVIERLPDTSEAQQAAQRLAHLATVEHLNELHDPRVIALAHYEDRIGLRGETVAAPAEEEPNTIAQRYVDHLRDHPLDNETREKLAMLYANSFHRLDLATIELEQLIATPNQTPRNVVHWLNLLADFQVRLDGGVDMARATLQRIIDLYPKSAAANSANVRLSQLRLELNQNTATRTVKMGAYEQNIGLRRGGNS
jgi:TolA-binding protein